MAALLCDRKWPTFSSRPLGLAGDPPPVFPDLCSGQLNDPSWTNSSEDRDDDLTCLDIWSAMPSFETSPCNRRELHSSRQKNGNGIPLLHACLRSAA